MSRWFNRTDLGNARLFARGFRDVLRYDHSRKRWLIWQKNWWVEDTSGRVFLLAKDVPKARYKRALKIKDDDQRKKEIGWALESEDARRLRAIEQLARSEPPLADTGIGWDADPCLFGVANGIVDLGTGKLRRGKLEDRITMHTEVEFTPDAECPRWLKFLEEIFDSDQETIAYAQRCVGYFLTGSVREQCIFNFFGLGGNGKSTFLETVRHVMGPYAKALPFTAFEQKARASIPHLAASAGVRLVTAV